VPVPFLPTAKSESVPDLQPGPIAEYNRRERRRWPCSSNGSTRPIRSCAPAVEASADHLLYRGKQGDIVRKILEHCGLWEDPVRGPPLLPFAANSVPADDPDSRRTYQIDPEFLEHAKKERSDETAEQLPLTWDD